MKEKKDERYGYKYTDMFRMLQLIYACKLVATDKTPTGKRDGLSLHEKVNEFRQDINDGIDTVGKKKTLCALYIKPLDANNSTIHMSEKALSN